MGNMMMMIELEPGAKPPYLRIYHMSPLELAEVKRQLTDLIDMGFIQPVTVWSTHSFCYLEEW